MASFIVMQVWVDQLQKVTRKSKWSTEEDAKLRDAVEKCGTESWVEICALVPGRTGKQCRERWIGQLAPDVTKSQWSPLEDSILVHAHGVNGNKWTTIALSLPGRSAISVKNRWNWLVRHNLVSQQRKTQSGSGCDVVLERKTNATTFDPIFFNDGMFGLGFQKFQEEMLNMC